MSGRFASPRFRRRFIWSVLLVGSASGRRRHRRRDREHGAPGARAVLEHAGEDRPLAQAGRPPSRRAGAAARDVAAVRAHGGRPPRPRPGLRPRRPGARAGDEPRPSGGRGTSPSSRSPRSGSRSGTSPTRTGTTSRSRSRWWRSRARRPSSARPSRSSSPARTDGSRGASRPGSRPGSPASRNDPKLAASRREPAEGGRRPSRSGGSSLPVGMLALVIVIPAALGVRHWWVGRRSDRAYLTERGYSR